MNLDIKAIINNKINEMAENKVIEKQIEASLEKTIISSVSSSFGGYEFEKLIREKISTVLGEAVKEFDFSSYHGFITDYFNQLMNHHLKEDLKLKVEKSFNQILFIKRDKVKLSEIIDIYRDLLIESLEDDKKYDLENRFYYSISRDKHTIKIKLGQEEFDRYSSYNDSVSIDIWPDRSTLGNEIEAGKLWRVNCDGRELGEQLVFQDLSKFEIFIINLYFNQTQIEIDVWDDVDTDLGLDM